jgi:hypothetical protein
MRGEAPWPKGGLKRIQDTIARGPFEAGKSGLCYIPRGLVR